MRYLKRKSRNSFELRLLSFAGPTRLELATSCVTGDPDNSRQTRFSI